MRTIDGAIIGGIAALLIIALGLLPSYVDDQSMKVCELSHSHDVCFQTLNR